MAHWTSANSKAFIHRITFDFIAQLEKRIEALGLKQSELARKLNVTEGAVSQVLNSERNNLTLKTMVSYATALGMKVAIVAYDDDDAQDEHGPVGSEIFSTAWEKIGRPRDVWSLNDKVQAVASNRGGLASWHSYITYTLTITRLVHTTSNYCSSNNTSNELSTPIRLTESMEQGSTRSNA